MAEATIIFKREDREGIIPVGTYLNDAAERLGVRFESRCSPSEKIHFCRVTIAGGEEHLSPLTSQETENFGTEPGADGERLACQARIVGLGEIVIMSRENKETEAATEAKEREYAKEFADLPLEKKFAELAQLEAIALGETFSFIFNSPYLVFDKVLDVMAGFGLKKEENGKKAARPDEYESDDKASADEVSSEDKSGPAEDGV